MIKKRGLSLCILLLLSALLGNCAPVPNPPAATPTIQPLPTSTHTASPSPSVTKTAQPPTPEPTAVPTVRFAVIGDYGKAGSALQAVSEMVNGWEVDFIITTGDNNYPDGSPYTIDENIGQYFHAYISPYIGTYGSGADVNRFFPSMGNHDWRWKDGQPYLDYFTLPGNERYYDFEWEFLHLFAVSSDTDEPDGVSNSSAQADWLHEGLNASEAPWQIVYFHHSPYSSGYHGSIDIMQWDFQDWGADLVLSGHDHHYERLIVDDLVYIVQGLSGASRYPILSKYPGSQVRYWNNYGALLVEATPDQLDMTFYTIDGEVIDQFSLSNDGP